ncbi:DNA repair protein Rev1-like isoform X1 [Palaemon carinicauda]|uniref:DNA repair protein Rev1-like isoform X1 n=1 Tax=Palaemon carinicauda TaxID=392227 RepID=UPI0035B6703A
MSRSSNSRGRRDGKRRGYGPTGFEEQGGYMAAKKAKLSDQFQRAAQIGNGEERRGIFRGVAIFVNGYTEPTAEELKRIMISNGGTFHHYYSRSKTTHIIASNLPDTKVKNLRSDRIVSPKWISDSLKAGHLLDYTNYILYTNQSTKQPKLLFKRVSSTDSVIHYGNGESSNLPLTDEFDSFKESSKGSDVETKTVEHKQEPMFSYQSGDEDLFSDSVEISRKEKAIDSNKEKVEKPLLRKKNETPSYMEGEEDLFSECFEADTKGNELESDSKVNKNDSSTISRKESFSKIEEDEDLFSDSFESVMKDLDCKEKNRESPSKSENESIKAKEGVDGAVHHRAQSSSHHISPSKGHSMSTANPKFLSEFYNNSRLHHISTMGAMFKQYVTELQNKKVGFPGRKALEEWLKGKKPVKNSPGGYTHGNSTVPSKYNSKNKRTIMHIDMDCFFVSVGLRNHPELKGKPVAVTHSKGSGRSQVREGMDRQYELNYYKERAEKKLNEKIKSSSMSNALDSFSKTSLQGETSDETKETLDEKSIAPKFSMLPLIDESCSMSEIASCSYEARKAGVRNGMFMGPALKLCPNLKTIPYDFEGYKEVAYKLYDIVASFTHDIEAVSCDEMFVDLTELLKDCQIAPLDFVSYLRQEVQAATNCPCSAGIGPNMLIARMATRRAKPNGQHMVDTENLSEYMLNEKVTDLPGVGWSLGKRLESHNIKTCGDLQVKSLGQLQAVFGNKTGQSLYYYCRGIDDRPVKSEHMRKSVSAEVNYGIRFTNQDDVTRFMKELAAEVESRLNAVNLKGKCITLKLKVRAKDAPVETAKFMGHGVCDNIAKSTSLGVATSSSLTIEREVMTLLRQIKVPPQDFRGVGIQVSRLEGHHSYGASSGSASIKNFMLSAKAKNQSSFSDVLEDKKERGSSSSTTSTSLTVTDGRLKSEAEPSRSPVPSTSMQKSPAAVSVKPLLMGSKTPVNKGTMDEEVLMALPEDLREQVIAEYRQQGYSVPESFSSMNKAPKPGTSHSSSESNIRSQGQPEDTKGPKLVSVDRDPTVQRERDIPASTVSEALSNSDDEALLSFSQVDSSFLAALPAEMREELRMDFEHRKRLALGPTSSHSVDSSFLAALPAEMREELRMDFEHRKRLALGPTSSHSLSGIFQSGVKSNSRGHTGANDLRKMVLEKSNGRSLPTQQVTTGKKRGRPPKSANNRNKKSPVKSKVKTPLVPSKELSTGVTYVEDNSSQESVDSSLYTSVSSQKNKDDKTSVQETNEEIPQLCGAVELTEVKNFIREWVSSCPNPDEEDVDIIASYYSNLIIYRDLEKVDLLIKYLYRQVIRTCNKLWQLAYCNVVERVQSVMLYHYEGKMKVPSLTLED